MSSLREQLLTPARRLVALGTVLILLGMSVWQVKHAVTDFDRHIEEEIRKIAERIDTRTWSLTSAKSG